MTCIVLVTTYPKVFGQTSFYVPQARETVCCLSAGVLVESLRLQQLRISKRLLPIGIPLKASIGLNNAWKPSKPCTPMNSPWPSLHPLYNEHVYLWYRWRAFVAYRSGRLMAQTFLEQWALDERNAQNEANSIALPRPVDSPRHAAFSYGANGTSASDFDPPDRSLPSTGDDRGGVPKSV